MPIRFVQVSIVVGVLMSLAPTAHALTQSKHYSISYDACRAVGYGLAYCKAVAAAAYNVDRNEWSDMTAHAQRAEGQSACTAAQNAANRVQRLAQKWRDADAPLESAKALGAALHTLQDECAHRGMTNAQHAHFSMDSWCGDGTDPDTTASAISCATTRTKQVFAELKSARSSGELACTTNGCTSTSMVSPAVVCGYFEERKHWNLKETRWGTGVGPLLLQSFKNGVAGRGAESICGGGDVGLAASTIAHEPANSCQTVLKYCGKVDDISDEDFAEFYDEDGLNVQDDSTDSGGCDTSGADAGVWMLLFVVGLGASWKPRRREAV